MIMKNKNVELILSSISKSIKDRKENYIIGIDGYSCAGKTSIIEQLVKHFKEKYPVQVFHIDDYITTREQRYSTGYEQWYELFYLQWNEIYIRDHLFKSLKSNDVELKLNCYNKEKDVITERSYKIASRSIVIVEGVYLQRKCWRDFFHYMIFVDCPRDVRFEREIIRSHHKGDLSQVIEKYKERYWAAEEYYDKTFKPLRSANLVINNC